MSLIDTWASTGTGAYSLSENGLYTVDAWHVFASRLAPDGIFSVSRWYFVDSPGETARMLSLATEPPGQIGAQLSAQAHRRAAERAGRDAAVQPRPFSAADIDAIEQLSIDKGFNLIATPRTLPVHPLLRELLLAAVARGAARSGPTRRSSTCRRRPTRARSSSTCCGRRSWLLRTARSVDQLDMQLPRQPAGDAVAAVRRRSSACCSTLLTLALADARAACASCARCQARQSPPRSATSR